MVSSSSYQITEPHPSVPRGYIHAGRGGAGNVTYVDPASVTNGANASGPASRAKLTPPPSNSVFLSGRGGAGNAHRQKERAIFSFDEELAQQRRIMEHQAPVYHVGRGGAGNLVDEMHPRSTRSGSASSTMSEDSNASHKRTSIENAWNRVSRTFSHK
ncbi:hypothetical protein M501DRAFT_1013390 [Patellaria atrata CBS 101060]|uniref:DUF3602 domain-containing protein n=1 Tax=Patellaria atrata CBS 101060 TaxID=1346257 RepID=A0A9P4VQK7_9PEZI|nr:hypothetical protein M501DRAFT_1013390 [Patellaria atrata CBS 101060]